MVLRAAKSILAPRLAKIESRVKPRRAKILHFATHGMLNNASPMYSHLALAEGGASEDGLLEAWELMQLDLQADLAVLSACETARGRVGAGEGMVGFSWAMFIAGVPSIVVSQWKVESAGTRDLMVNFHRGLISSGKSKPTKTEALRQAALKLIEEPRDEPPVLLGRLRPGWRRAVMGITKPSTDYADSKSKINLRNLWITAQRWVVKSCSTVGEG